MMDAILTKYHGATNTKGARITARMVGVKTVTLPYPYEMNGRAAHTAAACAMMARAQWPVNADYVVGDIPQGYVFVRVMP